MKIKGMVERKYLNRIRLSRGLTLEQMAEATGYSISKVQSIECGRRLNLYVSEVEELAYALKVKPIDLLKAEYEYLNSIVRN